MSFKKKVCIVIPVHSAMPSVQELMSFKQCFGVLGIHSIYIVAPKGLVLDAYRNVIPNFSVISLDPKWQSSVLNYNKLKLSRYFYSLFKDYEYLLTYELDAFVFKDELMYWCDKGYDYIGAPWFEGFHSGTSENKFLGVGNSGFSLRNIAKMDKALRNIFYKTYGKKYSFRRLFNIALRKIQNLSSENYSIQKDCNEHEDFFIFSEIGKRIKGFNIAPINEAIKFSFETNPKLLFEMNNQQLPFGCHAWAKYNPTFWKEFIPMDYNK
jgi:hypothetical protein